MSGPVFGILYLLKNSTLSELDIIILILQEGHRLGVGG